MTDNNKNASDWAELDPQLGDDRAVFSAARVRELLAADREQAPRSFDKDTLARFRRLLAQLGLGGAVPEDAAALSNSLFSVFGMMSAVLERRQAFLNARNHFEILEAFHRFSKQQGYDLTTCEEKNSITTENGIGPATFWKDATEHAWRGWANRPGAEDYRDRAHSAERGCTRAGLLFDPATREWMPPARHPSLADKLGAEHVLALRFAQSAACTCLTKTPDIAYHRPDCRYRIFAEIEHALFGTHAKPPASGTRHECTPRNGGTPYTIDRAPDSWELRECDIRPLDNTIAPVEHVLNLMRSVGMEIWVEEPTDDLPVLISFGKLREVVGSGARPAPKASHVAPAELAVWEPKPDDDIPVSVSRAIARAAVLLVSTGSEEAGSVAARLAYVLRNPGSVLPDKPDTALLASMATCMNHGFGMLGDRYQESMLNDMRKLYEEVAGRGYYRGFNRAFYMQWLSPTIEGGKRKFSHSAVDYRLDKKEASLKGGAQGQSQ
ncbi:hypothetical protein AB4Y45_33705 [Paraburkholderia sp. EG287A]|uniref:hypothetical protein n=1 Tax=Paraburkholderia sp. EG287A TaxID=3237012 RepID=UPI0034D25BB9